jgi:phosphohistidine swiveling domain-containing protein
MISNEIEVFGRGEVGSKSANLKKFMEAGFNVPIFISLPSDLSEKLFRDPDYRQEIVKRVTEKLKKEKYIVRSSALIEDRRESSLAGQFLSIGDLGADDLDKAIHEVLAHANFKGSLAEFSLIIQEYIDPDISGVTFTRNPSGGREMVIEYGSCKGEAIVGGKNIPDKSSFYWDQNGIIPKPLSQEILEAFKKIELMEGFPQDIEWCISDNNFYLLQVRPITTIAPIDYEQMVFLDGFVSGEGDCYYAKEGFCESIPRPTDMTLSIIRAIYAESGPVQKVYKKYGIDYRDTDFLRIIGNELFYDKERELTSLLPSYSYLKKKYVPSLSRTKGLLTTLKNIYCLNTINVDHRRIFFLLRDKLCAVSYGEGLREALSVFLENYEIVFEVNLLFGLAQKRLDSILIREKVGYLEIINNSGYFTDISDYHILPPDGLSGNHIELSDDSHFFYERSKRDTYDPEVVGWWDTLSKAKQALIRPMIDNCIILEHLREGSRWLAIKGIGDIRRDLLSCAKEKGFTNPKLIYFSKIEDVLRGSFDESSCTINKGRYESFGGWNLPSSISSFHIVRENVLQAISGGSAKGILCSIDSLPEKGKGYIVYVEFLSPDLVKYFDRIEGIVSNNGGLLSHLAIMARERGVPVVSGFYLGYKNINMGDKVIIDGSTGSIEKDQG